jgi:acetolactate synthase-1/2/3 large subunit
MDGDTVIAKILKIEGVEWMACFPHHSLIDRAAVEGIRPIITRQERTGVNMADGFSRINGGKKIGVFCMQRGPGAENAFGGVAQAFADSVPILVLPGGHARREFGIPPGFDAVDHYRGITKWAGYINTVDRIPEMMGRAFTQMRHGRRGPVLLEIPMDVSEEDFPGGAFDYSPVREYRTAADPDDVRDLVTALLKAKSPVINAGQGVLYSQASKELVEFAELTNVPVMTTLAGKSAFPEDHKLSLGTGARSGTLMVDRFLKKADFALGMGTSFTASIFTTPMPKGVTLAQSTNCAEDINKDCRIDLGAIGDSKVVLRQLAEEVRRQIGEHGRGDENGVVDEIRKLREEFMAEWGPRLASDEVPISPYRVLSELAGAVDVANTIITHDSGYPREQFVPFWRPVSPGGYIGWGKSTQLGYGLGLAMGAKLAAPDKQVINIMGDAAFGMSGMDVETAARAEIGILTVVLNNGVMTHYTAHMPYASKRWGSNRLSGDYAKVAEGLGAHAQRVDRPDQLGAAIRDAIAVNRTGRPAVLEVITKEEEAVPQFWQP